jgi:succinylarginine dihydrolase
MSKWAEYNFDGLVGLTHNFAGLSFGNIASTKNADAIANPKEAALQGLEKMWCLSQMGLPQAVLPPHERPHIPSLKQLGFSGSDREILKQAWDKAPHMVAAVSSASAMWVANAATISPALDTDDGKTHFTPANLASMYHRSIEPEVTGCILKSIFSDPDHFTHHAPLPSLAHFGDEGAANHTRLCTHYGAQGIELFIYGKAAFDPKDPAPAKFPARQTREASEAIARLHRLSSGAVVIAQQNPNVIDQGVFHNDVIAVGNENCLFYHQDAFANIYELKQQLVTRMDDLHFVEVTRNEVPVGDAVSSYLFNSQLVTLTENGTRHMCLIAPMECEKNDRIRLYLEKLIAQDPLIREVRFMDVRQSMRNGGGPACLRLRVALSEPQKQSINARVFLDETLYSDLKQWVKTHYRDQLRPEDLSDPKLLQECRQALDELTQIMKLGPIYDFQRS